MRRNLHEFLIYIGIFCFGVCSLGVLINIGLAVNWHPVLMIGMAGILK